MGENADGLQAYVVSHIDDAIRNGWIRVFYQPVVRTVSGKLCGMEALARWDDPDYGLLPPDVFIGALEQARLIHKLDAHMVRLICGQIRERMDAHDPVVPVSFNLSRLDFDLCDISAAIEAAVHDYEIPRTMLNIEITESVFGSDPAFMTSVIDAFHKLGYQVWMDDFGSAYSSLNVLKDFDFDELKIDMAFLSTFDDKSRTIIASVVDMAKRLGIQTLAEGVETPEHSEFLRHIGCEKQQGYLYSKPRPYTVDFLLELERELGIERQSERKYFRSLGSVNTLSLSERDFMPDNTTKDYVTSMPLALVEFDGERFSALDYNAPFVEALQCIQIAGVEEAMSLMNDTTRLSARTARRLMGTIEQEKFSRQDYLTGEHSCTVRARYVASHGNRISTLVAIDSAASTSEQHRRERMEEALEALYSIYEHVDVIHLDEDYAEPVYSQSSFKRVYDEPGLRSAVRKFADNEVFEADRGRYVAFMEPGTILQRIEQGGQGFIVGFFRMRDHGGDYAWKLIVLIRLARQLGQKVMICIRDTNWENDALFQAAYEKDGEREDHGAASLDLDIADLHITDGSLWRALSKDSQFGIFWKNDKRQFVGCNDRFLEYYGFDTVDEVLGKTDEDMGWHVDPIPFMHDEQRVLNEGVSVESAIGQCIVRGELRDIVATKRPIYRNGRIVGLVGYFIDVTEASPAAGQQNLTYLDTAIDVLNYSGVDAATGRFIEAYKRSNTDFSMTMIDIGDFARYTDQFGYEFGDKILRRAADVMREIIGTDCILGHMYVERFVVLKQNASHDELERLGKGIVAALGAVSQVEGTPVTLYAHFSIVSYAEVGSFDEFKRLGRERLQEVKLKYQ